MHSYRAGLSALLIFVDLENDIISDLENHGNDVLHMKIK